MKRHAFIWGWLRMALGIGQMSFAAVSIITLIAVGLRPLTYALAAVATCLAVISRILYRGRKDPELTHPPKK